MKNFENFKKEEKKFIIGYGLSGGFGGINNYEVIKEIDIDKANIVAWEKACEEYESYVGNYGLRTIEEIMEEEGYDEEVAEEEYNEERESWLDYYAMEYNEENLKKVKGYHFYDPYKDEE